MTTVPDHLLTAAQVAVRLSVSERTVSNLVLKRLLPVVKVGGRTLFEPAAVDAYVRAHRQQHRVPLDFDFDIFNVAHGDGAGTQAGQRRSCRLLTLNVPTTSCNDRDLCVPHLVWEALTQLARAGGYEGPLDGKSDLGARDATQLAKALEAAEAVARLARRGQGIRFGVSYPDVG